MTYKSPELLLIGAAQNLVLNGCGLAFDSAIAETTDYASCREDNVETQEADILLF